MINKIKLYVKNGSDNSSILLRSLTVFLCSIVLISFLLSGLYKLFLYLSYNDLYIDLFNSYKALSYEYSSLLFKGFVYLFRNLLFSLLVIVVILFYFIASNFIKESVYWRYFSWENHWCQLPYVPSLLEY